MRPAAPMRLRRTALRSTIRAYWTACTAVGVEFVAPLQRLGDSDDVDGLAPFEELDDRRVDRCVRLAVEVRRSKKLGHLDDRVPVDQDGAEHGLLGLETLRRQTIDHGPGRLLCGMVAPMVPPASARSV